MSYKIGRRFEYRVIERLKELGIEVIRNELSRKPDLWTSIGLFEVKKSIKKGKDKCFVIDIKDYINKNWDKIEIKSYDLEDKFYTLTIERKRLKVVIPFYMSLEYKRMIDKNIERMLKKYEFYLKFKEVKEC